MTRSRFHLILVVLITLGIALHAHAQTSHRRVLFLGNSITKHGPKADIDWTGNWGMAASEGSKDYVSLVTKALTDTSGSAPEILVKNIADFERAAAGYDFTGKLKEVIDFQADLIILAIGENVPGPQTAEDKAQFQASVTKLLTTLKGDRHPVILVRSCFWANPFKDEALQAACTTVGGIFVDISALGKDEQNYARSERPFKHAGVANHPGDHGMAAIAESIVKALPK
ncbi:MAG: SGNH/GDSL hydrolase family protein [Verrucomicrobiales bacterium]|nr:SGNH/GDSL hydrolase family protein [Verrucomicrobiae bacterium]MCP5552535.1 SGNH/GDSL hydrolase family protein [Akkermansiaceae bacterium]